MPPMQSLSAFTVVLRSDAVPFDNADEYPFARDWPEHCPCVLGDVVARLGPGHLLVCLTYGGATPPKTALYVLPVGFLIEAEWYPTRADALKAQTASIDRQRAQYEDADQT